MSKYSTKSWIFSGILLILLGMFTIQSTIVAAPQSKQIPNNATQTQEKPQKSHAVKKNTYNKEKPVALEDVQLFSTAISHIKRYYVKPTEDKELFEDAIRGMLNGLDPHSAYLDIQDYRELQSSTRGEFGGLGIEVTQDKGVIKVITPIDDTPAKRSGIKSGDYIVRIGNKSVKNMSLRDAVGVMRGKKGTTVNLLIIREGVMKPLKFTITREIIQIKKCKKPFVK